MADNRAIGVFDSGVGGLTVFSALRRRMPEENLIYFGDTAHVPYGSKSRQAVERFSLEIARFLTRRKIKLLVVACNTASALALTRLKKTLKVPVFGVIEPGVRAALGEKGPSRIGVIATEGTVASGVYEKELKRLRPGVRVLSAACPLFVPLVEEGWWSNDVTNRAARRYLAQFKSWRADTLILGCTHYPLLKAVLRKTLGARVRLIDSAQEMAREVDVWRRQTGASARPGKGSSLFYASDGPQRFLKLAKRFLKTPIKEVKTHQFD